jgi:hypothetical protein
MLGLVRRALWLEVSLYVCLARWVLRRPAVGPGQEPIGYARAVTPVLCLGIFASAAEIPLAHVLLPWHAARIGLLVLGAWGLVWMLGLLASYRVRPHLLGSDELRLRNGAVTDVPVALADVARVRHERMDLESSVRSLQVRESDGTTELQIGVSGQVNVVVELRAPVAVRTPTGPLEVGAVRFFADEPRAVVTRLRESLAARDAR